MPVRCATRPESLGCLAPGACHQQAQRERRLVPIEARDTARKYESLYGQPPSSSTPPPGLPGIRQAQAHGDNRARDRANQYLAQSICLRLSWENTWSFISTIRANSRQLGNCVSVLCSGSVKTELRILIRKRQRAAALHDASRIS